MKPSSRRPNTLGGKFTAANEQGGAGAENNGASGDRCKRTNYYENSRKSRQNYSHRSFLNFSR